MSTEKKTKINRLLQEHPKGTILLSSWLSDQGYSFDLQKRYRKSRWLESIGTGAMKRTGDEVNLEGAIYALQNQLNLSVHIGGKSALAKLGKAHFLEFQEKEVTLFGQVDETPPKWFLDFPWEQKLNYHTSNFLPKDLNMVDLQLGNFTIQISGTIRAIMECLYLSPEKQSLTECYELMESLNYLSPKIVESLLEQCNSIKVKRLFLYLAEKAGHAWFKHLKLDNISLGTGKRSIVAGGIYIPKYQMTIPRELVKNESGI